MGAEIQVMQSRPSRNITNRYMLWLQQFDLIFFYFDTHNRFEFDQSLGFTYFIYYIYCGLLTMPKFTT